MSNSSNASFISWRCSSVISWRTLEWSREEAWSWDRDEEEAMGVCCGEEGRCVLRRGLFALDGYIVNDRTKQHETATLMEINQLGAKKRRFPVAC